MVGWRPQTRNWWSGSGQMSKTPEQTGREFFETPMRFWFKFCGTGQTDGHHNQESKAPLEEPHQARVDTRYLVRTFHKQCHKHLAAKSSVSEFEWLIVVDTPEMSKDRMPVGSCVTWNMAENGLLDRRRRRGKVVYPHQGQDPHQGYDSTLY